MHDFVRLTRPNLKEPIYVNMQKVVCMWRWEDDTKSTLDLGDEIVVNVKETPEEIFDKWLGEINDYDNDFLY